MSQPLKILLIEDDATDLALIKRQIYKVNPDADIHMVSTYDLIAPALDTLTPDLVLSDYNLGDFTGLDVLSLLREKRTTAPLVFITGTLHDEELAAESILSGAQGFILKKNIHRLHEKLGPLMESALSRKRAYSNASTFQLEKSRKLLSDLDELLASFDATEESSRQKLTKLQEELANYKSQK